MNRSDRPGIANQRLAIFFLILGLVLHVAYIAHHRVNSDEPQHLHVAWVVAHGGTQYQDVFDNHSPLFSMLMSPIVGAIGERSNIVVLSRLWMVPLVLISLALVWRIAASLYAKSVALWVVAATLLIPDFTLGSVEYRTDQLWTTVWMATLAILLLGRVTVRRIFFAGVFLGISFSTSMKTSILGLSLAVGWGVAAVLARRRGVSVPARRILPLTVAGLAGMLLVPAAFAAYFVSKGALSGLVYGTIGHNLVPGLGSWRQPSAGVLLLPLSLPVLLWVGRWIVADAPDAGTAIRRGALFLGAGLYYFTIQAVWPLITRQDFLPFVPMAAIVVTPCLLRVAEIPENRISWMLTSRALRYAPSFVLIFACARTQVIERVWVDQDVGVQAAFLGEVLRMTRPHDLVMDIKGETIFRMRPYYYALEPVTEARIESGLLSDSIPDCLVETRTPVAVRDTPDFPKLGRAFLLANYIPAGPLRYVGAELAAADSGGVRSFEIRVPQHYALVSERGPVAGSLDGTVYNGARVLDAGPHVFQGVPSEGRMDALWADAVARGATPFSVASRP